MDKLGVPESLFNALRDEDNNVRRLTVRALSEIGNDEAIRLLIIALGDEEEEIRAKAKESLVKIGKPVVKHLIQTLGDVDE